MTHDSSDCSTPLPAPTPGDAVPDDLRGFAHAAADRVTRLRGELDTASHESRVWHGLAAYRDRGWWCHLYGLFEREAAFFIHLRAAGHPGIPLLEALCRNARTEADRVVSDMPRRMDAAAAERDLPLDRDRSMHPKYFFHDGFFTVEIDERKQLARVRDNEGKLRDLPADPEAVAEFLLHEDVRVFGRKFNGGQFLKKLRKAYLAVLKSEKKPDQSPVPLRRLGRQLRCRMDEFIIDVSTLAAKGPLVTGGLKLQLQQSKDTEDGVLLYGPAGRGMVNLVIFQEETV